MNLLVVIFLKPWQGYGAGERAGFEPPAVEVLVRTGFARLAEDAGRPAMVADCDERHRAMAAAAAQGHPIPNLPPLPPGGQVTRAELLSTVSGGSSAPPAPSPAPMTTPAPPGVEVEVEDGPRPEDLMKRRRKPK